MLARRAPAAVCIGRRHTLVTTHARDQPKLSARVFKGLSRARVDDEFVVPSSLGELMVNRT